MDCSIRVGSELLLQVKVLKYLRVLFTSEGEGLGTEVIWVMDRTVVVQRELSAEVGGGSALEMG